MQYWEHKRVLVTTREVWQKKRVPYTQEAIYHNIYYPESGSGRDFQSQNEMWHHVQDMGMDGFELVSAQDFRHDLDNEVVFQTVLWFKRPIE